MAIQTINPTTEALEQTCAPHSSEDVEQRVAAAQTAFEELSSTTFAQRVEWMRRSADVLERDLEDASRMLTREMGKTLEQACAEVLKSAKGMRFYAEHAEAFLADEPLTDPGVVGASAAWTRYDPIGIVLAVMPWNYPLWQVIRFAAPALMAGNTGLLKHASNVPQSALYLDTLFARGGFPDGAFKTLLISSADVADIIRDPRVRAVTLTGSEAAGRAVAATAAGEVKKSVLELGGSDPFIVMPSADIDAAVATAVKARISNNGQSCIAAKRFIVHADVFDVFAERFARSMSEVVLGDPLDPGTQLGPLATRQGRDDLAQLVDDATAKGATTLTGGRIPSRSGWFYEPTAITDLTDAMRIVQEETFGPVASLYRAVDRDEAVRLANRTDFGLSSAVWTRDVDEQHWFARALDAGAVFINGMTVSYPELPFGGVKNSGFGRELAAAGIREFCNLKTVWTG